MNVTQSNNEIILIIFAEVKKMKLWNSEGLIKLFSEQNWFWKRTSQPLLTYFLKPKKQMAKHY